ncbi:MAG: VWA domain-containing protein [Ruminococcus sp.]|nr:VWA domain-containing protein [Ruminococcus sp.]
MSSNKGKIAVSMIAVGIIAVAAVGGGLRLTRNIGKSDRQISREQALDDLTKLLKKIDVTNIEPRKAQVEIGTSSLADELPDISKYPLSVYGDGDIDIEIFSSTEKSGRGTDGWLNEIAERFNEEDFQIDGRDISVSVRPVASGLSYDYIVSGKYVPHAYTPSNELWGDMIDSEGIDIRLEDECLVSSTAGILVNNNVYNNINSKYGSVTLETVVQATVDGEIAMGYTNPYSSSTGLNFLVSALNTFDSSDILSQKAVSSFVDFQANVPFVAYTTLQMREAVESGSLDAFIFESQLVFNDASLKRYSFIPFGVEHNNPMYSLGRISPDEQEVLKQFISYCKNDESQKLAEKYGFNQQNGYKSDISDISGNALISAQKLWKEEKNAGKPVVAVFVADMSGSMDGDPIRQLKRSLINGSQYISDENYIGLVTYNNNVQINLPIDKFTLNHRAYFTGAVEDMSAVGGTATFDAVAVASDMLVDAREKYPDAKIMMFVLSDGETNTGCDLKDISEIVQALEIPIYTIGYNADLDELSRISAINEAASINADSDDVVYALKNLFNAQV